MKNACFLLFYSFSFIEAHTEKLKKTVEKLEWEPDPMHTEHEDDSSGFIILFETLNSIFNRTKIYLLYFLGFKLIYH